MVNSGWSHAITGAWPGLVRSTIFLMTFSECLTIATVAASIWNKGKRQDVVIAASPGSHRDLHGKLTRKHSMCQFLQLQPNSHVVATCKNPATIARAYAISDKTKQHTWHKFTSCQSKIVCYSATAGAGGGRGSHLWKWPPYLRVTFWGCGRFQECLPRPAPQRGTGVVPKQAIFDRQDVNLCQSVQFYY